MAISKERTVYISVLSVGLAAFAGDRLLSSGPASASAAEPSAIALSGEIPNAAAAPNAPTGFPHRLRAKAAELPDMGDSDAFLIPAAWLPAKQVPIPVIAVEEEDSHQKATELASLFSLTSVYAASERNGSERGYVSAVIKGTLIEKGSAFDLRGARAVRSSSGAYVLEEIASDHVQIRVVGDNSLIEVRLKMDTPGNGRIETRTRPESLPKAGK